jgi:hypothetical protein
VREVIVGWVLACQQVIDKSKTLLQTFAHGNGHCAVQFGNRGWLNPKQLLGGALGVEKLNSATPLMHMPPRRLPMENMYYIGLDVHKKTISYCVKDGSAAFAQKGRFPPHDGIRTGMKTLPQPWTAAMEATIHRWDLRSCSCPEVAHPLMLRAIAAAKKKNDHIDVHKIADCLRCDFLPECYLASTEIRKRWRRLSSRKTDPLRALRLC